MIGLKQQQVEGSFKRIKNQKSLLRKVLRWMEKLFWNKGQTSRLWNWSLGCDMGGCKTYGGRKTYQRTRSPENCWTPPKELLVCSVVDFCTGKTWHWHLRRVENVPYEGGVQNPFLGGVSFVRFSTPLFFPPAHGVLWESVQWIASKTEGLQARPWRGMVETKRWNGLLKGTFQRKCVGSKTDLCWGRLEAEPWRSCSQTKAEQQCCKIRNDSIDLFPR